MVVAQTRFVGLQPLGLSGRCGGGVSTAVSVLAVQNGADFEGQISATRLQSVPFPEVGGSGLTGKL